MLIMDSIEEKYEAEINKLNKALEQYRRWTNDLQSGMYINCVYCGHRYGPRKDTPVAIADALKKHIEQCPEHPLSAAKEEIEKRDNEIEELRHLGKTHKEEIATLKAELEWQIYRPLMKGETTKDGDQGLLPDEDAFWTTLYGIHREVPDPAYPTHCHYRRRVAFELKEQITVLRAEIVALKARVSELNNALRLHMAVSPDDPLIITPVEKEIVILRAEVTTQREEIAALKAEVERLRGAFREQLRIEPPFYTWTGHDLRLLEIAKAALKEVADES